MQLLTPPAGFVMDGPPQRGLRPGPERPTFIPAAQPTTRCTQFADVAALARFVQRRRAGRGLQLVAGRATCDGSDSFPIFRLYWLDASGDDYAGALAVQGRPREALEAAIAASDLEAA